MTKQTSDQHLASKFNGTDVIGADDAKIGDVSDVLFDKDHKVIAFIVGVGGFLGIGAKDVAIDPASFQAVPGKDANDMKLRLSMTKDELKAAPAFEPLSAAASGEQPGADPPDGRAVSDRRPTVLDAVTQAPQSFPVAVRPAPILGWIGAVIFASGRDCRRFGREASSVLIALFTDIHGNREAFEAVPRAMRAAARSIATCFSATMSAMAPIRALRSTPCREFVARGAIALLGNHDSAAIGTP